MSHGVRLTIPGILCGISLVAPVLAGHAFAAESILRVGKQSVTIPDKSGVSEAERQDALAKLAFMQNFDKTGQAFTVSLPPWARPIKEFHPGQSDDDGRDTVIRSPSLSSDFSYGMGAPHMGVATPRGVHKPIMPTSTLTMEEDVPRITFESCVRMKLNSGIDLGTTFQMCQSVNSAYQAPPIPSSHAAQQGADKEKDAAASSPEVASDSIPDKGSRSVLQTPLGSPPAIGATGWVQEDTSSGSGMASGRYAGSECDVSRDPTVMLSQECLKRADAVLEGSMASAESSALHVPLSMQPGQQSERHSLLATISPRPVPQQDINFASVNPGQMLQRNMESRRTGPSVETGSVSCDWAVNGASFGGVQYGHGRSGSVKSCIRSALTAANIDTGTIGISLRDQAHGINQTVVECHRRNGQDTCGLVR